MSGSFGNTLEDQILDHVLKVAPLAVDTNLYLALYTVAPTDAGGGTELSGDAYVRVVCNSWSPSVAGGLSANAIEVLFPEATADWGTVVAFAVWNALTGGTFKMWADLTVNRTILDKDSVRFNIGELIVTLD